ncbi:hypothetical protein OUZ56_023133 [Daphnia magna]|uniref:Uncharacterized protein n=1 Tax=Daphnia magna TaxID=35525 RepID=A0ABR0AYH8_9CRUS|nr:hypothetical protein OUZ56_023133 [Daphnia magna]
MPYCYWLKQSRNSTWIRFTLSSYGNFTLDTWKLQLKLVKSAVLVSKCIRANVTCLFPLD